MELFQFIILLLFIYILHLRQIKKTKALSKKTDVIILQIQKISKTIHDRRHTAPFTAAQAPPIVEKKSQDLDEALTKSSQSVSDKVQADTTNVNQSSDIDEKRAALEKPKEPELKGLYSTEPKNVADANFRKIQKSNKPSWFESFKKRNPDLEKFIGENLINKIGILILVLGISYFVKFAIDKEWINEPARVGIGILCGSLLMVIAHRLRAKYSAFSSVLVAGGISIYYFTIFIAFQDYQLFSQTVAFTIMTVITAFSTLVSISYNRQELALLALFGGLASPFLVSSGDGNYQVFFTYLILLNAGILAVSYFKKWKLVNLVSFVASTLFFAAWLFDVLDNENFPQRDALLFSSIFYLIFSISNVINNIKSKGIFNRIERSIIIANTFIYFGFGYQALAVDSSAYLSLYTLAFAVYNILYALVLFRKLEAGKTNIYLLIGLALSFVTLAIPLQFEGNQITLFWAAEAVLLFWLSIKSKVQSYKLTALIVQVLALISLVLDWAGYWQGDESYTILLNKLFITGLVVIGSLIASRFLLRKEGLIKTKYISIKASYIRDALGTLALISAYFIGLLEVNYQAAEYLAKPASDAFGISYHLIFMAALMLASMSFKHKLLRKITMIVSVFSFFIYLSNFSALSEKEVLQNLANESHNNYAFYLHYLQLASFIVIAFVLIKDLKNVFSLSGAALKYTQWAGAISVVLLISIEVSTHSLFFLSSSIAPVELGLEQSRVDLDLRYDIEPYYYRQIEELKTQIVKVAYPIAWGLIAFAFLLVGIKNDWKTLRIIALSLLGLTIIKLFFYDIKDVSETGKIVAFILLGALILTISFVYQKIKKLVVDEKQEDENT